MATLTSYAQNYQWAKSMGGSLGDYSHSLVLDSAGNIYTVGFFSGTVDFDPGVGISNLTNVGMTDIFISKLDTGGNFIWAKSMGGPITEQAYSISLDGSSNIYITGIFSGTVDFDPGIGISNLTSAGVQDIFISKLDPAGNFMWVKRIGGNNNDISFSSTVDAVGNVYVTGYFSGTVDFNPGLGTSNLTSAGLNDIFILKLDQTGNYLWTKGIGGVDNDFIKSIALDGSGNIYAIGSFKATVDFDPGAGSSNITSAGDFDIFILKLDEFGNFNWAKSMGGNGLDNGNSIALDSTGNIYVAGDFYLTSDFDPGAGTTNLTSVGDKDIFISKLDGFGNLLWAKSMGGNGIDDVSSMAIDHSANIYTTGSFQAITDFDPSAGINNLTSAGWNDVYISKLNAAGNLLWAESIGGSASDAGNSIALYGNQHIYITGTFEETIDFDPDTGTSYLTSAGLSDIFILKLNQCVNTTSTLTLTACNSYVSPSTNYTWTTSGIYIDTLPNAAGCDSVITFNLTINSISDLTTSTSALTLTSNNTSGNYQWLDCDNNYAMIAGEIGQSFTPTNTGNYAVALNQNGCIDTSACVNFGIVGLLENSFGNALKVYPNPTKGAMNIDLGESYDEATVTISNALTQEIFKKIYFDAHQLQLNIPGAAGLYFIEVNAANKIAKLKVVKE